MLAQAPRARIKIDTDRRFAEHLGWASGRT
jgi:hypothetical protein